MRLATLLPLAGFFLAGCAGYHIGPVKPQRMAGINSIAVLNFKNETLVPRVEVLLADAVIKQFQLDGTYKIARENDADAIFHGRLEAIQRSPARSVLGNVLLTEEYNLNIRCTYTVTSRATGERLMSGVANGQTSFFASGTNTVATDIIQDERQALPLAAEQLAKTVVSHVSEGW